MHDGIEVKPAKSVDTLRCLKLADMLEQAELAKTSGIGFNMRHYYMDRSSDESPFRGDLDQTGHKCGTVACIAGWAVWAFGSKTTSENQISTEAKKLLGLDAQRAYTLFCPDNNVAYGTVTVDQAVKTLRKLALTGEVDWSHVPSRATPQPPRRSHRYRRAPHQGRG